MRPKYQVLTFTECMWLRKRARFDSSKRRICSSSRAYAWMTRTPVMPSCSADRFAPTFSRTSRYALFASRWNFTEAAMMNGKTMRVMRVSSHDSENNRKNARNSSSAEEMNCIRPNCTSSDIDSTSAVMRDTRTPAFSRSKNAIDWRWMWANTFVRRRRRNPSPAWFSCTYWARAATYETATTTRYAMTERLSAAASLSLMPASMPWRTSTGPASVHAVVTMTSRNAHRAGRRNSPAMRRQRASTTRVWLRSSLSDSSMPPPLRPPPPPANITHRPSTVWPSRRRGPRGTWRWSREGPGATRRRR